MNTDTERRPVKTEAEIEDIYLPAKEHEGLPATTRSKDVL